MSVVSLPQSPRATAPDAAAKKAAQAKAQRRAWWLRQVRQWHWISSALCLIGMLAFAITGFTLNHAGAITAEPKVAHRTATLPPQLRAVLARGPASGKAPLPPEVRAWAGQAVAASLPAAPADWSAEEAYLALPRPGGDAWLSIQRDSGAVEYELTTRGTVSLLNDLHKGRNTGPAWGLFLDVFAGACVLFCVTGLLLLQLHSHARKITWPLVAAGLVVPVLIVLVFIHL